MYSLITGTIEIINISIEIYNAVKDKDGIPLKLRKVSDKLPSLVEILKGAEAQYKAGTPDASTWAKSRGDVERCKDACQQLQDTLKKALPESNAGAFRCFMKTAGTVLSGKGKTAEQLLADISGYLELLMDRQILTHTELLEGIKKTVDELVPQAALTQNNVNGPNFGRDQNFMGGEGPMFNGPGVTYNAGGK